MRIFYIYACTYTWKWMRYTGQKNKDFFIPANIMIVWCFRRFYTMVPRVFVSFYLLHLLWIQIYVCWCFCFFFWNKSNLSPFLFCHLCGPNIKMFRRKKEASEIFIYMFTFYGVGLYVCSSWSVGCWIEMIFRICYTIVCGMYYEC